MSPFLPTKLPTTPESLWETKLPSEGHGGIAATAELVIVGSRDVTDTSDVFTCHRMSDGTVQWQVMYPAFGKLDYGNSPRATPLIVGDKAVLLGAFGDLKTVQLETGEIVWESQLKFAFDAELPIWGFCGSPLLVQHDGKQLCIVQTGSEEASLVAFDLANGELVWESGDEKCSYASFILARVNGTPQIIGYDATSLGGWSLSGQRLWKMKPDKAGDFNVPTPLMVGQKLFVTTENNGARLYEFKSDGTLNPEPVAVNKNLAPDTHSPVLVGELICGTQNTFQALSEKDLSAVGELDDLSFAQYTSAISDGQHRVLITTLDGELILIDVSQTASEIVSRLRLSETEEIMAHPAMVDRKLIVRVGRRLVCLEL